MKNILFVALAIMSVLTYAQSNNEKMAIAISNADDANTEKLKAYAWKRKSDVSINGEVKLTIYTEFSFDAQGKLQAKITDADSNVKQKRGLRGRAQKNAAEDKAEYASKALELSVAYTFMTKGQLLDFFGKATVSEKGGMIEATGENIYVQGDKLTIWVDKNTNLYTKKKFSSLLGKDAVDGEINYEKFSSGVNHGSTTMLNMPAQKMKVDAKNQDYSQRVK
jgi:hypothetical protein